ncbi:MAG: carboxymuconolactone decarboxylase family protein [Actinomycetota bacterium]|nr:carboxymuconolactone decarboxylase family protein [Actinomycetota bacterium]
MTQGEVLTRYRFEVRAVLIQLGAIQGTIGFYALFFPRSFFEDFPLGLSWVEVLPAYNEHLTRDVGGFFLATAVMLIAASIRLERRWVVISLIAFLAFSVPHTTWHAFNLEPYSTGDAIANIVTLAATVLLPLGVLFLLAKEGRAPAPPGGAPAGSNGFRIEPVSDRTRNPMTRISYAIARRRFGDVPDPMRVYAHNQTVMTAWALHELATERATKVPPRLKHLASMRAAMVAGCEWCLDFGSFLSKGHGVSQDEMRELPRYRDSQAFDETEKLVMDYATAMTRSPVDIPDDLFAKLRERFDEAQLVELTDIIALENYRARFNWAFGLEGQGFSEGAVCVPPEPRTEPNVPR